MGEAWLGVNRMTTQLLDIACWVAALGSGLMAGLFFAFSVAVMPALARVPAAEGMRAMQTINRVIVNGWFLAVFLGTALACAATVVLGWGAMYLVAGALLYLVGCIGVTAAFNIPLNNELMRSGDDRVWARYLSIWTRWNHLRAVACLAATAMFYLAISPHSRS